MIHKHWKTLVIAASLACFSSLGFAQTQQPVSSFAQQNTATPAPTAAAAQPLIIPAAPNLDVKAYVLMDANSGKILAQKNMDEKFPPASLTKLMTLYVTSQSIKSGSVNLTDKVRISKKAWKTGGSKMFVKVGNDVPLQKLIQGIIVDSGNDACVATAEYVAGSEDSFVDMMNAEAKRLGMVNTQYKDCTGLPITGHHSTAHDLAILARAIINDFPQDYQWYKQKWLTYNGIRQPNRNRLLWRYPGTDGLKTGHTAEAGYCLISSAKRDGLRLVSVVLGAKTDQGRADNSIRLLNYGFRFYESHLLYQANSIIKKIRVWYGDNSTVNAGVLQDLYITMPKGQYQNIKIQLEKAKNLKAPIKKGQAVGQILITLNGQTLQTVPLVALENNAKGGMWRHAYDWVAHLI